MVVFSVENEEYAICVNNVLSIEKSEKITPIPQLPPYIKGIVKVRDELVPIVDLLQVLYDRELEIDDTTRFIIVKTDELHIGLHVRDAKELIEVDKEQIKQVGFVAYERTAYFTGVIHQDNRLITMIDPNLFIKNLDGIKDIYEYMEKQKEQVK